MLDRFFLLSAKRPINIDPWVDAAKSGVLDGGATQNLGWRTDSQRDIAEILGANYDPATAGIQVARFYLFVKR